MIAAFVLLESASPWSVVSAISNPFNLAAYALAVVLILVLKTRQKDKPIPTVAWGMILLLVLIPTGVSLYQEIIKAKPGEASKETIYRNNLAELYRAQGKYAEAEPLYKRALVINEKALGADYPYTATSLNNLAMLYDSQGKHAEAEQLLKRALAILERTLGAEHPNFAKGLENYAYLLRKMNREAEAAKLEARAKEIRAKAGKK